MKNYVVGICSMFENEVKLFKIQAENEYEAAKAAMVDFCEDNEAKAFELNWQQSDDYPKDLQRMIKSYEEITFNVIEV